MKQVFEKLHKYIGKSIKSLIERPDDPHCLRLHKNVRFLAASALRLHSVACRRRRTVRRTYEG